MTDDSPFRRLLFAVDETEPSRRAFPLVAAYARAWRADVHLVHVQLPEDGPASTRASEALVGDMVDALTGVGIAGSGQVHSVGGEDTVGTVIARLARHVAADLVVVGSRGRTGVDALDPIGISHLVAAELTTPVLVARCAPGQRARPARVMVAIDGSAAADLALSDAIRVAAPTDAIVRVLHVQEPCGATTSVGLEGDEEARRVVQAALDAVRRDLEADAEIVLAVGDVAQAIARAAVRFDADLVVVASRRPSDLQAFLVGSVAQELVHVLELPVLLAHRA
jgi:nucleotide-binding universal stress UspA family protein